MNQDHVAALKEGPEAWTRLRASTDSPDLRKASLDNIQIPGLNLNRAMLGGASLRGANLSGAQLRSADLTGANLDQAKLVGADLRNAKLIKASLVESDVSHCNLRRTTLRGADMSHARIHGANLTAADLLQTRFRFADIEGTNLTSARLVETDFSFGRIHRCTIYGVSAWNLSLEELEQSELTITQPGAFSITVDDLEVAQFIHLLLRNDRLRGVLKQTTSTVVLLLGRFTGGHEETLHAVRALLRARGYVPVVFDFPGPEGRALTSTIQFLAHMSAFIVADITGARSVAHELATIAPTTPIPIQALLKEGHEAYATFHDLERLYDWVRPICVFSELAELEGHLEPLLESR